MALEEQIHLYRSYIHCGLYELSITCLLDWILGESSGWKFYESSVTSVPPKCIR